MRRPMPARRAKRGRLQGGGGALWSTREFSIEANPPGWEGFVHLDADKPKTGLTYSRESAIFNAKNAIDEALDTSSSAK
jgi:hypothetical protein